MLFLSFRISDDNAHHFALTRELIDLDNLVDFCRPEDLNRYRRCISGNQPGQAFFLDHFNEAQLVLARATFMLNTFLLAIITLQLNQEDVMAETDTS